MHPSKVTLRPKVRRPMAWDSTKSAPARSSPRRRYVVRVTEAFAERHRLRVLREARIGHKRECLRVVRNHRIQVLGDESLKAFAIARRLSECGRDRQGKYEQDDCTFHAASELAGYIRIG